MIIQKPVKFTMSPKTHAEEQYQVQRLALLLEEFETPHYHGQWNGEVFSVNGKGEKNIDFLWEDTTKQWMCCEHVNEKYQALPEFNFVIVECTKLQAVHKYGMHRFIAMKLAGWTK